MSNLSALQEALDWLTEAVERIQRDLPVIAEHAHRWQKGYPAQLGGGGGGGHGESSTQRIATTPGPDPTRDVARLMARLRKWAEEGLDLDKERGRLKPLDAKAAKDLAALDEPGCRLHARAGSHRPRYSGDLCRTCHDFSRDFGEEPPDEIVRMWVDGKKPHVNQIKAVLAHQARPERRRGHRATSRP